jgi:hypothetical protein
LALIFAEDETGNYFVGVHFRTAAVIPTELQYRSDRKEPNLIDDAGALADQPFAHAVQGFKSNCPVVLVATNFIVGRWTASAISFSILILRRH